VGAWGNQLPSGVVGGGPRVTCIAASGAAVAAAVINAPSLQHAMSYRLYYHLRLAYGDRVANRITTSQCRFNTDMCTRHNIPAAYCTYFTVYTLHCTTYCDVL
jgi:hypothetical protein